MRGLAFVSLLSIASMVMAQSKDAQQPIPPAVKQAEGGKKAQLAPTREKPATAILPSSINVQVTGNLKMDRDEAKPHGPEEFPKWTDIALAIFTGLLTLVTAGLIATGLFQWLATRDTARKQLRAYVALGNKGLYFNKVDTVGDSGRPKLHITNFGQTPASKLTMWRNIVDDPPGEFSYSGEGFLMKDIMLHPGHTLPLFWAARAQEMDKKFLYGYIEYSDIYDRRWQFRFAYQHRGGTWFTPYERHNEEVQVGGPRDPWWYRFLPI